MPRENLAVCIGSRATSFVYDMKSQKLPLARMVVREAGTRSPEANFRDQKMHWNSAVGNIAACEGQGFGPGWAPETWCRAWSLRTLRKREMSK